MILSSNMEETQAIAERYARRSGGDRYSMLRPEVWQGVQERQRCILRLFGQKVSFDKLSEVTLVEVGCGTGSNLMEFLRVGFAPENLSGIELLPERVAVARRFLPVSVSLLEGDASKVEMPPSSKDIVFQAVVFSSPPAPILATGREKFETAFCSSSKNGSIAFAE